MDLMRAEERSSKGQTEAFRRGDGAPDFTVNVLLVYDMVGQSEQAGSHTPLNALIYP